MLRRPQAWRVQVVRNGQAEMGFDLCAQRVDALAGRGDSGQNVARGGGEVVDLVPHTQGVWEPREKGRLCVVGRARRVEDQNDQVGRIDRRGRVTDGGGFDGVEGVTQAGRVDQHDGKAVEVGNVTDPVARRPGEVGDDRPLGREQLVREGRFADVGHADDGDTRGVQQPPEGEVGGKFPTAGRRWALVGVTGFLCRVGVRFPRVALREQGADGQLGASQGQVGQDVALDGVVGVDCVRGQGRCGRGIDVEAEA